MFTVQTRTLLQQPMSDRRLAQPPPIFMSTTGLLDGFNLSLGCEKKITVFCSRLRLLWAAAAL